ncbi:MAG: response regulator [Nitrospinota bacterium]|nr:MAG: response regulator [Nitrospinota bacterium]
MKRILVIDDEAPVRRMLRQTLEYAGYTVVEAEDGKEGLKQYRAEPADLVITDILMPEKEGLETIRELRREFPETKIIAISGGGRSGVLDFLNVAEKLGAHRTFHKPFSLQDLLTAIRELLETEKS